MDFDKWLEAIEAAAEQPKNRSLKAEYLYLQMVRELMIEAGMEPKIPKKWALILPTVCRHDVDPALKNRIWFSDIYGPNFMIYDYEKVSKNFLQKLLYDPGI